MAGRLRCPICRKIGKGAEKGTAAATAYCIERLGTGKYAIVCMRTIGKDHKRVIQLVDDNLFDLTP